MTSCSQQALAQKSSLCLRKPRDKVLCQRLCAKLCQKGQLYQLQAACMHGIDASRQVTVLHCTMIAAPSEPKTDTFTLTGLLSQCRKPTPSWQHSILDAELSGCN